VEHVDAGLINALAHWLEASALGSTARSSLWLYPLASVLHILGLVLLVGAIGLFDLRLLGGIAGLDPVRSGPTLLALARAGFAVQVVTGVVMLAADAHHLADNPAFLAKLGLIGVALVNLLLFHLRLRGNHGQLAADPAPGWARTGALVSLLAWISIAGLGRFVAYV
jgi:hypothetical protein